MNKSLFAAMAIATAVVMIAPSAHAGGRSMTKANGTKVSIKCTGGGCVTSFYNKSGKRTKTVRGQGGRFNFNKIVKRMRAKGYN